jgi:hypothetical protein
MKKLQHLLFLAFLCAFSSLSAQKLFKNQLNFGFSYWNSTGLSFNAIEKNNGNYIFNSGGITHSMVGEMDPDGNMIWAKGLEDSFGGIIDITSLIKLQDDGFLVSANGSQHRFYKLLRFDSEGELVWSRFWGRGNESNSGVIQTKDNGFAVVGHTGSNTFGLTDVFIAKIDTLGTVEWARSYGTQDYDRGYSIFELENGDFLILGYATLNAQTFIMRVSGAQGDIIFARQYELIGLNSDQTSMIQLEDGNFVLRGAIDNPSFDPVLMKIDEMGMPIWSKQVNTFMPVILKMNPSRDSSFLTHGFGFDQELAQNRTIISKFDSEGNPIWSSSIDSIMGEPRFVGELEDRTILTIAEKTLFDSLVIAKISHNGTNCFGDLREVQLEVFDLNIGSSDLDFMTDGFFSQGDNPIIISDLPIIEQIDCSLTNLTPDSDINQYIEVFPNPASNELNITYEGNFDTFKNQKFSIWNLSGRHLKSFENNSIQSFSTLDISDLLSGFYILRIELGSTVIHRKFLKH